MDPQRRCLPVRHAMKGGHLFHPTCTCGSDSRVCKWITGVHKPLLFGKCLLNDMKKKNSWKLVYARPKLTAAGDIMAPVGACWKCWHFTIWTNGWLKILCASDRKPSELTRKIVLMFGNDSGPNWKSFDCKSKIKTKYTLVWWYESSLLSLRVSWQFMNFALQPRVINCELPLSDKVIDITSAFGLNKDRGRGGVGGGGYNMM